MIPRYKSKIQVKLIIVIRIKNIRILISFYFFLFYFAIDKFPKFFFSFIELSMIEFNLKISSFI